MRTDTKRLEAVFVEIHLFSEKQLVRMADAKILTEICDALLNGIRTTNRKILDRLYRTRDHDFPEQADLEERIESAVENVRQWGAIHNTSLIKPHIMYSLILAIIHLTKPVQTLQAAWQADRPIQIDAALAELNLTSLVSALDAEEPPEALREFVRASTDRTNVKEQREIRFRWFCHALSGDLPA